MIWPLWASRFINIVFLYRDIRVFWKFKCLWLCFWQLSFHHRSLNFDLQGIVPWSVSWISSLFCNLRTEGFAYKQILTAVNQGSREPGTCNVYRISRFCYSGLRRCDSIVTVIATLRKVPNIQYRMISDSVWVMADRSLILLQARKPVNQASFRRGNKKITCTNYYLFVL